MDFETPIIAAIALDSSTAKVVEAATELAKRIGVGIVPVHAHRRSPWAADRKDEQTEAELREEIVQQFASAIDEGIKIAQPIIEDGDAAALVRRVAGVSGAQAIVVGGGEAETISRWLLGSTAERIIRSARQPVWVARATTPGPGRRIVCPVDRSPQSRMGFVVALRMARLFDAPLRLVTIIPPERHAVYGVENLNKTADELEAKARQEMEEMVGAHDTTGVHVEIDVMAGRPVDQILDGSHEAHLIVVGSSGFDKLLPGTFGGTSEKVVRGAWSSVVTVWDSDPDRAQREARIRHVVSLKKEAEKLMSAGKAPQAELLLRSALDDADGNPALHEALAATLEAQGQESEGRDHRALAKEIRDSLA